MARIRADAERDSTAHIRVLLRIPAAGREIPVLQTDVDLGRHASRTIAAPDPSNRIETVTIGPDSWGRAIVSGRRQSCWVHVASADTSNDVVPSAAVTAVQTAPALGLSSDRPSVEDGDGAVVLSVDLPTALAIAAPQLASKLEATAGRASGAEPIRALLTTVDGRPATLGFLFSDVRSSLLGSRTPEVSALGRALPRDVDLFSVGVTYEQWGQPVQVERPPASSVVEPDDADQRC